MSEIIPGLLWQCGATELEPLVRSVQPRAVINLDGRERAFSRHVETYVCWPIEDGPLPDLRALEGLAAFVHGLVAARLPVIVHCNAGLNRSGLIAALVVARHLGMSGKAAVAYVRAHREYALCNPAFAQYLEALP